MLSAWGVYRQWGPHAEPAIAPLIAALKDPDQLVRGTAADALGRIGPQAKAAVPEITAALTDGRINVFIASGALQGFGHDAEAAVPGLVERLKSEVARHQTDKRQGKPPVRYSVPMSPIASVINVLGSIGPAAKEAMPLLLDLADDEDPVVRSAVVWAFPAISPDAAKAIEAVLYGTQDQDVTVQLAALRGLSAIGNRGLAAVPALTKKLLDKNEQVRRFAALALGAVGSKEAVPALRRALRDRSSDVRIEAANALLKFDSANRGSWEVLKEELQSQRAWPREQAAFSLGELGLPAEEAVPLLVKLLKDDFVRVRAAAAEALGKIGPAAAVALPDLKLAARDREQIVKQKAILALMNFNRS